MNLGIGSYNVQSLLNLCIFESLDDQKYNSDSIATDVIPFLNMLGNNFKKRVNVKQYKNILLNNMANPNQNETMKQDIQNAIRKYIEDYCSQYLKRIKGESKKLLTCNIINEERRILLNEIASSQTFDDLPEDMQDIFYDKESLNSDSGAGN